MLELGAGFHPELSGRDNIFLNGSILGLTRRQIAAAMDEIIEFSGIGEFVDVPVKVYSSGMYVRLGFSIAANLDPELLIIDEIVAVGDEDFQRRCFDRLYELRRKGTTIVFVSHSLALIQTLCDRVAWIDHGRLRAEGPAYEVVDRYVQEVNAAESDRLGGGSTDSDGKHRGSGELTIRKVEFLDESMTARPVAVAGAPLTIRIHYEATKPVTEPVFGLAFHHETGVHVSGPNSQAGRHDRRHGGRAGVRRLPLRPTSAQRRHVRGHRGHRRLEPDTRLRLPGPGLRAARPARPRTRCPRPGATGRPVDGHTPAGTAIHGHAGRSTAASVVR